MTGILAIWNDCAPEGETHYERWYKSEHMQERVGVPGFRFGRRYERLASGDRRFFTFYEVERADVLSSRAYVERLENPTPWTTESMKHFRNMVRTVCDQRMSAGDLIGSHAVVVRADEAMAPTAEAETLVARLAADPGVGFYLGVAPVLARYDYGFLAGFRGRVALISPTRDEFSDPARLETLAASLPEPWVRTIDTDHFFGDALDELAAACGEAITWTAPKS